MAVNWSTIYSLGIPLGLWLFRNGMAYYRTIRQTMRLRTPYITPLTPAMSRALYVLWASAFVSLCYTLPYFTPENIFRLTNARLQTDTNVIFNRLTAIRGWTPQDRILREKFTSKDNRLRYFAFGPDVLVNCPFCKSTEASDSLLYALPSLMKPHLFHMLILGLVTSTFFAGKEAASWRRPAMIVGGALAVLDLYLTATYDLALNTLARGSNDIDFFYWKMRLVRGFMVLGVDLLLAAAMYLSGTNRLVLRPAGKVERIDAIAARLEESNRRLWGSGCVRNAVVRDRELRDRLASYWGEEGNLYEEPEVVEQSNEVMKRVDMSGLETMADQYAENVTGMLSIRQGNGQESNGNAAQRQRPNVLRAKSD